MIINQFSAKTIYVSRFVDYCTMMVVEWVKLVK